jgi:hypothetical protein
MVWQMEMIDDELICEWCDLLLWLFLIGEVLLILLPAFTRCAGHVGDVFKDSIDQLV